MPNLTEYRRRFAQDLRAYRPDEGGLATGGTASTLIQANYPIQRNLDESAEFDGWQLLRPGTVAIPVAAPDRVRSINPGLYAPRSGTFTVDRPYAQPPVNGEGYELHGHGFEPFNGVNNLLNAALRDIHVIVTIPYVPRVTASGTFVLNLTDGDGSGTVFSRIPSLLQPGWVHAIDLQPTLTAQAQLIQITGGPSTGTWIPSYRGVAYAGTIALSALKGTVQTALRTLPGLEAVEVSNPTGSGTGLGYPVLMRGAPVQGPAIGVTHTFNVGGITADITTEAGITVPQRGRVDLDGAHVLFYSERHYDQGDVLYIRCRLRASDWARASSSTAYGSLLAPLSAEAHEALPVVEWVSAMMQVWGWRRRPDLMQQGVETRQIASQATAQAMVDGYQREFLRRIERSRLLRYPVEGGEPMLGATPPVLTGASTPAEVAAASGATGQGGQG